VSLWAKAVLLGFFLLLFIPKSTALAYTSTLVGGSSFDGTTFSINCLSVPDFANTDIAMKGVGTSTYPLYIGEWQGITGTTTQSSQLFCQNSDPIWQSFNKSSMTGAPAAQYYFIITYKTGIMDWADADYFYTPFYWDGSTITGYISTTTPFILSFTYSTTTDYANVTGYWEATSTPHINQRLTFWQYTALFGQSNYQQIVATTTGYFNFSFPFTEPTTGTTTATTTANIITSYVLNASLDQFDNRLTASLGYPDDTLDYEGYKINLDATSTIISSIELNYTSTLQGLLNYPEYECSITSLTGCFKNAMIYLFYPTADTITNYYHLIDLIKSKPPAGYFYLIKSNLNNLSATSTAAFSVTIPASLKNYIFIPFDASIAAILWFYFIINFYKRLKHITI